VDNITMKYVVCSSLDMMQEMGSTVCSLQSRVALNFEHGTSKGCKYGPQYEWQLQHAWW
ncbi:hypothetical protein MKW92_013024, partial [Papaver armeniacum]